MRPYIAWTAAATAAIFLTVSHDASAQADMAPSGKPVELWIGGSPGGGYDATARVLARSLPDHLPGKPSIVAKNVAGAGGLRVTNLMYNSAPKDGFTFATATRAIITMPLLGVDNAKFDPTKFIWVGSVSNELSTCVSWHTSGVRTLDDARARTLNVGTTGPGTSTHTYALVLQRMLGAKVNIVGGYPEGNSPLLAMERQEVDATCGSLSSIRIAKPSWVRDHQVNFLVVMGSGSRDALLPDVPAIEELVTGDEQRAVLKIILTPQLAGRPFFLPPGVSDARAAVLRQAFDATMKDDKFLAEANRVNMEVSPMSGDQIQQMIKGIYDLPADVADKAKAFVN